MKKTTNIEAIKIVVGFMCVSFYRHEKCFLKYFPTRGLKEDLQQQ